MGETKNYYLGYITYANSGILIYEQYLEGMNTDTHLLAGMLTALQALSKEITETEIDEFEFHKFQIYLAPSRKYPITHGIITNGAQGKNNAIEMLDELSKDFEKSFNNFLDEDTYHAAPIDDEFSAYVCKKLADGNEYFTKLNKIRSEFFDVEEVEKDKNKKEALRDEFF